MRRLIHKLILWYYKKEFREITKVTPEEEIKIYLFGNPDSILKVIRSETTRYVLKHFEEDDDRRKWMAKGAAVALNQIRDAHLAVFEINSRTQDPDEKIKAWQKIKQRIFTK